jgi:hypothetical protein
MLKIEGIFYLFIFCRSFLMSKKYVYSFEEGNAAPKSFCSAAKEQASQNDQYRVFPVPQGISRPATEACIEYYNDGDKKISDDIKNQIFDYLQKQEAKTGKSLWLETQIPAVRFVRSVQKYQCPE